MGAFGVLTVLARIGFYNASDRSILERLSFLGALIEVFQSIPALRRDCDPLDWVADTFSVVLVLVALAAIRRARNIWTRSRCREADRHLP